jgi:hypothetical protein
MEDFELLSDGSFIFTLDKKWDVDVHPECPAPPDDDDDDP